MALASSSALATFELENNIQATDTIYHYDSALNQKHLAGKPWTTDPRYFKHVKISALALVKMVMHARSGGSLEIMGLMLGKIDPDDSRGPTMIVMDVFALPVEGTETRVNAQADAYEYMVEFISVARESGRLENVLGWYHSHPGYGCWLSGIDVSTQMLNQQYQEPWLAIVIDPHKTAATGKVDIGAFRTYPQGYKAPEGIESEFESVPLSKVEDFGAHQNQCVHEHPNLTSRETQSHVHVPAGARPCPLAPRPVACSPLPAPLSRLDEHLVPPCIPAGTISSRSRISSPRVTRRCSMRSGTSTGSRRSRPHRCSPTQPTLHPR